MSNPEMVYHDAQKFARTIDALDLLVNNAGVQMRKKFTDFEFESCQKIMNTNCTSHIALTKAMIPVLRASGQGQIVFISSMAGLVGTGMQSMYSSAKFALTGFARSIRPELKDIGIHTTVIYPGKIRTDLSQKAVTGINRTYGQLDEFDEENMQVGHAVKDMLIAIHKGEIEHVCSDVMWDHWMTLYRGLSWWTEDTEGTNEYRRNLVFTKKDD